MEHGHVLLKPAPLHGGTASRAAATSSGSKFTEWSGACSGSGSCSVTMDATKSVTATVRSCTVVVTGTGNLTARAATRVSLRNGFQVASGGVFTAGIDGGLAP